MVWWRSVADVEGLKADTLSAIAEGVSRITAERNKHLNLHRAVCHGTVGESMVLLIKNHFGLYGVFELAIWFPGDVFLKNWSGITETSQLGIVSI